MNKMELFNLKIVTPDGCCYDGKAQRVIVRTVMGDVGILAHHVRYIAPLGVGKAKITDETGSVLIAAAAGGMISVSDENVYIVASTFEWSDDIDVKRAENAAQKAKEYLDAHKKGEEEWKRAEYKLKRALNRINVGQK